MYKSPVRIRYIAFLALVSGALLSLTLTASAYLEKRMSAFLAKHGAGDIVISERGRDGNERTFEGIRFGSGETSTIGSIRATVNWPGIFSDRLFSKLEINQLNLSGSVNHDGMLEIAGLKPSALLSVADTADIIVNEGQINLVTPSSGTVRVDANGHLVRQPDGSRQLDATLQSTQEQLALDMRWTGSIRPDRSWTADAKISRLNLDLKNLKIVNGAGWLGFHTAVRAVLPTLSGQVTAERMLIGSSALLSNATLTLDGGLADWHVVVEGQSGEMRNIRVNADFRRSDKGVRIHASLESRSLDDLLEFVTDLNNGLQSFAAGNAVLTTLLITPGNFSRIRQSVAMLPYDTLELVMDGTPFGLTAKIITRKIKSDDDVQQSVVSMNPGDN